MSKIALGTAQFGLDYGINNTSGEISQNQVNKILDYAIQNDIDILDTAYNYGKSEEKIGKYLKFSNNLQKLKIISKLPGNGANEPINYFDQSLQRLNQKRLYGYMVHGFDSIIANPSLYNFFVDLKKSGRVQKIGISLYYPKEIDWILDKKMGFDFFQMPYNIFDHRFEPYFLKLKKLGKHVYIRSVFLQGLVFKNPNTLDKQFDKIRNKLIKLRKLADELSTSVQAFCLHFALMNKNISKIIIGIDNIDNLKDIINISKQKIGLSDSLTNLSYLSEKDENIILPFNWKL